MYNLSENYNHLALLPRAFSKYYVFFNYVILAKIIMINFYLYVSVYIDIYCHRSRELKNVFDIL